MKRLGCLASLVIVGFFGYAVYLVLFPPRVGGTPFAQLPPQVQKERRVDAQKLVKDVESIARAARKKEKKPFTIVASEDQLNTLLQDRLKTQKFIISNLRAGLSPGLLTVQGDGEYKGFSAPATMEGTLEAKDGTLDFHIQSLKAGPVSLPENVQEKAEKMIGDELRKAFGANRDAHVDKVTIESGKMTIEGRTG